LTIYLGKNQADGTIEGMDIGDSTQHKISQKISLVTADEEQIWQEDIDLTRRMPKEKIVPEDWSILDIFLPPSRESAPAPDQST
jgi:hypothetical protein